MEQKKNTLHYKGVFLATISLLFACQCELSAQKYVNFEGRWNRYIYVNLPDNCILNDSTCRKYGIAPLVSSKLYFYSNGKGYLDHPTQKYSTEFIWNLTNDTLNIKDLESIVQYKIDKLNIQNEVTTIYLRLLSPGTFSFGKSFVASLGQTKYSDFLYDPTIKNVEITDSIKNQVLKIKKEYRIDETIIGYKDEIEKKYHYIYMNHNLNDTRTVYDLFYDIDSWKNGSKYVLIIQYDNNHMQNLIKLSRLTFSDDKFLQERIYYNGRNDFQINQ